MNTADGNANVYNNGGQPEGRPWRERRDPSGVPHPDYAGISHLRTVGAGVFQGQASAGARRQQRPL
jgi:hypothetical protein